MDQDQIKQRVARLKSLRAPHDWFSCDARQLTEGDVIKVMSEPLRVQRIEPADHEGWIRLEVGISTLNGDVVPDIPTFEFVVTERESLWRHERG
jgi:hypothetical protein